MSHADAFRRSLARRHETVALTSVESTLLEEADSLLDQAPPSPEVDKARSIIQGVINDTEGDDPTTGPGGY